MDIAQVFEDLTHQDLQWLAPVAAGLVIVIGSLFIGIIRGMSVSIFAALLLGGAMSLSPVILRTLEEPRPNVATAAEVRYARDATRFASLESETLRELVRIANSMRLVLDGLAPLVEEASDAAGDAEAATRYKTSLDDLAARIESISGKAGEAETLLRNLTNDVDALAAEADAQPR